MKIKKNKGRRKMPWSNERKKDIELKIKNNKKGMELVQVGILIAIAIVIGLIFRTEIISFVNGTFSDLNNEF